MGFGPREVDQMTPWEMQACIDGWKSANQSEEEAPPPMSDDALQKLGIEGF